MIKKSALNEENLIMIQDVKNILPEHIKDHMNFTDESIYERFHKGRYKQSDRYAMMRPKDVLSWFTITEDTVVKVITRALNNSVYRSRVSQYLNLWDRKDEKDFPIIIKTNDVVGKFVTRKGSWKITSAVEASYIKVIFHIEPSGLCENAGISIKAVYPEPNPEQRKRREEMDNKRR